MTTISGAQREIEQVGNGFLQHDQLKECNHRHDGREVAQAVQQRAGHLGEKRL
jgi:hypothetical protein